MTDLTTTQFTVLRSELGDSVPPTDADLQEIYDRRLGLVGVVREVWRKRMANFLANPTSFTIPGDYAQSTTANLAVLERKLARLAGLPDDSDDLLGTDGAGGGIIGQLTRVDPSR